MHLKLLHKSIDLCNACVQNWAHAHLTNRQLNRVIQGYEFT